MSRQDRQGVRTPAQLEQKYNFGQMTGSGNSAMELKLNALSQLLSEFIAKTNSQFAKLEEVIAEIANKSYQKGDTFYETTAYSLSDFDMTEETICVVKTIQSADGTETYDNMLSSGSYLVTFSGWVLSSVNAEMTITLAEALETGLGVGDKCYFSENESGALCLSYVGG